MDCVLLQRAPGRFKWEQLWSDRVQELHFGVRSRRSPLICRNSRVSYDRPIRFAPRCSQNGAGVATEVDSDNAFSESDIKAKAKDLRKDLKGCSIYFIGMMGSGKTTVGKLVADALGYGFFDSDKVIEDAGGATIAEIFERDEEEFRDAETEVLAQLSLIPRLVVATGGGAVLRSQNWGWLHQGIIVNLDVPLEALAKRVVAAGTEKRPLLAQHTATITYEEALARLKELYEQRGEAYANADVTVSLQDVANNMGLESCNELSPELIALKVIEQVHDKLKSYRHYKKPRIGIF